MLSQTVRTAATIAAPPRNLPPDKWADENRILPPDSAEPGAWRSARNPYMIPIMRAAADPKYKTIVAVMGAQMGKTEALFNAVLAQFDLGPARPALYIGPTEKNVRSISTGRILKALQTIPSLWAKTAKGHRLKVTEYSIAGARFGMAWSGSSTELASHPAAICLVDEVDRMEQDIKGEGDPVTLARARTKTYPNSKVIITSTPTTEFASPIWSHYLDGTMGKWAIPCPHCEAFFVPRLELVRWQEKATPTQAHDSARLVCDQCGGEIYEHEKQALNAQGKYVFHALDDGGEHVRLDEEPPNRTASFWVSGAMSPWQTFGELAEIMVKAYRSGSQDQIKAATNTYAGEVYRESGDAPRWQDVAELRRPYERRTVPEGVQLVTMGVDVQKLGLYFVVRGWGFNSESWLLDHGFIPGETEFDQVWILLARMFGDNYLADARLINRVFVDSGYRPGDKLKRPEHQVYKFARQYPGLVFPTKGADTMDRPNKMSRIDLSIGGRVIKGGVKLWRLNTDYYKSMIHSRIRWPAGEPGGFNLCLDADEDYCRQLVAEEVRTLSTGRRRWVQVYPDNHYLDCEVGAYAAAETLQVHTLRQVVIKENSTQGGLHKKNKSEKSGSGGFRRRPI
jgi:phage terminase large subunit GpA-like protein